MAIRSVEFDAGRPVNGVSFDGQADDNNAPHVAVNPGHAAPAVANPPANPVDNDGLRARQVVIVHLPGGDFELSLSRVRADGSEERLDSEFNHDELMEVAARIEALALQGTLCNGAADFSGMNTLKFNLHRGDRLHAFTLERVRFTPNGGSLQDVQKGLYDAFVARMQAELSNLGQVLGEVHSARRGRCEQQRDHGEHPSQKNL